MVSGYVLITLQQLWNPTARVIPGMKMSTNPKTAPRKVVALLVARVNGPRNTARLKFGPGKVRIIPSLIRKSRDETEPG